jgi:membrane protease YdiL (CAAX protease family)
MSEPEEEQLAQPIGGQPDSAEPVRAPENPPFVPELTASMASRPRPERIPHLGHVGLLLLLVLAGTVSSSLLVMASVQLHAFGIVHFKDAATDIRFALGGQAILYAVAFGLALLLFPPLWNRGFFEGLQWNGRAALRLSGHLVAAAFVCFLLALLNGALLPSPTDAPIDKLIRSPGAPWLLFAFGVTFAPFFEELAFRGFLLPALCTASDWTAERLWGMEPAPLDPGGHPRWSMGSMAIGSVCTSIPFALMHAEQTAHALGPFLLLIFVSLVLCATRLATRSLAASVIVHACYNLLLFLLMLAGTGGFRHLDQM